MAVPGGVAASDHAGELAEGASDGARLPDLHELLDRRHIHVLLAELQLAQPPRHHLALARQRRAVQQPGHDTTRRHKHQEEDEEDEESPPPRSSSSRVVVVAIIILPTPENLDQQLAHHHSPISHITQCHPRPLPTHLTDSDPKGASPVRSSPPAAPAPCAAT
jgi:hypothetical protein